ncbi:hypothetical protein QWY16_11640 [Planococcus shenhongbingii]|uniref:hypothetical protein n=1 Tax=Planococcus shenhongbingii TaxID=3058398 RepID=UPI00261E3ACC|nr:hypothetical protein [Planococcus sp. N016]WKA57153.1 hypothetical protein QWY16_11640 [Planococcus sp. N016]
MNYYLFEAKDFELNLVFVEEELQTFQELWEDNVSLKHIAKQMRRHPSEIALLVFDHAERGLIKKRNEDYSGFEGGRIMAQEETNLRLQDVKISETGILKLDIMELPKRCVLVISEGKVKIAALHPHAEIPL